MNVSTHAARPIVFFVLILAGAFQTLTFAPYKLWLLGPISIALVLWITRGLEPCENSPPKGFLYGWLFGLGLFGSGASWVYISINTYGHAPPVLAGALTILFVAGLALFSALNFWLYFKLRGQNRVFNGILFSAIWVLGDGFRTVFLTGFPWLFLGYGHIESPLAGWAPILGVYGIGWIVVSTGVAITLLGTQERNKSKILFSIFALALWASGPVLNNITWTKPLTAQNGKTAPELSVALIQTNIPQELKWRPTQRAKTLRLLEKMTAQNWQSDLIIWPETAVPMLYDTAQVFLNKMSTQASLNQSNIISGIPYRHFDTETRRPILHNSIVSLGQGEGVYHKQKLVPFGEYVPMQDLLRGLIAFFDLPMSDFRTGSDNQPLLSSLAYKTSPFICYEVVYPDFVAQRAVNAHYLITISNDSWFGASIGPLQHLEMAQMRAAENAKFMVRGTNNGISAIINEKGLITDQSDQFVQTTLLSKVTLFEGRTPFSYVGSLPLFLICGLLVIFQLASRIAARKRGVKSTEI